MDFFVGTENNLTLKSQKSENAQLIVGENIGELTTTRAITSLHNKQDNSDFIHNKKDNLGYDDDSYQSYMYLENEECDYLYDLFI